MFRKKSITQFSSSLTGAMRFPNTLPSIVMDVYVDLLRSLDRSCGDRISSVIKQHLNAIPLMFLREVKQTRGHFDGSLNNAILVSSKAKLSSAKMKSLVQAIYRPYVLKTTHSHRKKFDHQDR